MSEKVWVVTLPRPTRPAGSFVAWWTDTAAAVFFIRKHALAAAKNLREQGGFRGAKVCEAKLTVKRVTR